MEAKKWYLSVTIWFNVALLIVEFINALGQFIPLPTGLLTGVGNLGNILLRFKTNQPIK